MFEATQIGETGTGRSTACVLALLAVLFSLVSPALCAPKDCMLAKPAESTRNCQGTPMGNETGKTAPSSPMYCCYVSQYPVPATQTPVAVTFDLQAAVFAGLDIALPQESGSENLVSELVVSSPPTDLLSLFCTLLI